MADCSHEEAIVTKFTLIALAFAAGLLAAASRSRGAELVMFDDPTCSWCRRWDAEIGKSYARTPAGQQAPLRRVYIRDQDKAGVALVKPITATPTFVLVEEEQEVGRIAGYVGQDFFYPMLDELLRRIPSRAPPPAPELRSTMCIPGAIASPEALRARYNGEHQPSGDSWLVSARC
jgi:hypothetical protein